MLEFAFMCGDCSPASLSARARGDLLAKVSVKICSYMVCK